jgi:predicted nuclease with TOPRIM domain
VHACAECPFASLPPAIRPFHHFSVLPLPPPRTLHVKFGELERQLEEAQREQYTERDAGRRLGAQVERLQGRLKEAHQKQAELSQQLW